MEIKDIINGYLDENNINPTKGLGDELFMAVSALVPIVNVDLLVYNDKGQFLLTWRNDPHCGQGWHVPGGCIRFREKAHHRVKKVAMNELGISDLTIEPEPIKVFEFEITDKRNISNQNERSHFITLVYKCYVPDSYVINNHGLCEHEVGYIKWFDKLPKDFLEIQDKYRALLSNL